MIKIYIKEEYGFKHWLWIYPKDKEQLIKDWRNSFAPLLPTKLKYFGELKELTLDEVGIHHFTKKYKKLWVRGGNKDAFYTDEYKALQAEYQKDLDEKWPVRAHIFNEDDTYLIVDNEKYIPNIYMKF